MKIDPSPEFIRNQALIKEFNELKGWFKAHPVPAPPANPPSLGDFKLTKRSRFLGILNGRKVYSYACAVTVSSLYEGTRLIYFTRITSTHPSDAAHLLKHELSQVLDQPFLVHIFGPKGGLKTWFVGYESLIANKMFATRPAATSTLV